MSSGLKCLSHFVIFNKFFKIWSDYPVPSNSQYFSFPISDKTPFFAGNLKRLSECLLLIPHP